MKFFRKQKCKFNKPVVTMGTFDGVHLGHQKLLQVLRKKADEVDGQSIVITYYHHPLETIHKKTFPYLLTERDQKEKLLKQYGSDCVIYLDFDSEMASMEPEAFLKEILIKEVGVKYLIVGYDTHFGRFRKGNYSLLEENQVKYDYQVESVEPYALNNHIISSSIIRDFVREGDMLDAARCLGRYYSVYGLVTAGKKIGRELGFPTINLKPNDSNKLLPGIGVYVCEVIIEDTIMHGVTNIGYSPTLKTDHIKEIETYILDFDKQIYDKQVEINFHTKIRDEKFFKSRNELIEQIDDDVRFAKKYFENKTK